MKSTIPLTAGVVVSVYIHQVLQLIHHPPHWQELRKPHTRGVRVRASAILIRAGVSAGVLPEKPVYTLLASAQPFYKCIVSLLDSALD